MCDEVCSVCVWKQSWYKDKTHITMAIRLYSFYSESSKHYYQREGYMQLHAINPFYLKQVSVEDPVGSCYVVFSVFWSACTNNTRSTAPWRTKPCSPQQHRDNSSVLSLWVIHTRGRISLLPPLNRLDTYSILTDLYRITIFKVGHVWCTLVRTHNAVRPLKYL